MDKLYYISQGETEERQLQNIKNACDSGCELIQLRVKNVPEALHIRIAEKALVICKEYQAALIINDSVSIAEQINAEGVHLGKNDMPPLLARERLGEKRIIGGTANTYEDCLSLICQKVDYIGLGPFQFTTTKKNLSPVLGFEKVATILSKLESTKHTPPIYAIGGIEEKHIAQLYETGVYGVAFSGLLSNKPIHITKKTIKKLREYFI